MAYSLVTNVTDYDALLGALKTFATGSPGWTAAFDTNLDISPNIRQLGLEKGNCHVVLGSRNADIGLVKSPSGTDTLLSMALCSAFNTTPPNRTYFGAHTLTIVTSETDNERVRVNDLGEPPFANVWFFSNAAGGKDYIHCVVQTSAERYSHFGFGIIDPVGQTHADCAFLLGQYYEWWPVTGKSNSPHDPSHIIGAYIDQAQNPIQVYVPSGVLPGGYPATNVFGQAQLTGALTRVSAPSGHYATGIGKFLDFFLAINNAPTTGGTAMYSTPILFQETTSGVSHVMLGIVPGMRHSNIFTHTPAEITKFGPEEWVIFPMKRKGLRSELFGGSGVQPTANSAEWAFSYKKNV